MKITDYKIVSCCSTEDLTIRVKENLVEGWQPFGRITAVSEGKHPFFDSVLLQTLVKYDLESFRCLHCQRTTSECINCGWVFENTI